jgi:hypothetical protein
MSDFLDRETHSPICDGQCQHTAGLRLRYTESQARNQQLIHELERLRSLVGEQVRIRRSEPAIILDCSHPGCLCPPLTREVAPPEDCIPQWVRGMDWGYTADGGGYLCPEHRHAK